MPRLKTSGSQGTEARPTSTKKILEAYLALLEVVRAEGPAFQHNDIYFVYSLLEIPFGLWPLWLYEEAHTTIDERLAQLRAVLTALD